MPLQMCPVCLTVGRRRIGEGGRVYDKFFVWVEGPYSIIMEILGEMER